MTVLLRCACWFGGNALLEEEEESFYDSKQQCCSCCGFACGIMQRGSSIRVPTTTSTTTTTTTTTERGSMNDNYLTEVVLVAKENPENPLAWGWPYQEYKQTLSLLVEKRTSHGNKKSEFSYLNLKRRALSIDESEQLWTSGRYARNGKSTEMKAKSAHDLRRMNFGLKQKGGYYNYTTQTLIDPTTREQAEEQSSQCFVKPASVNTPSCSFHKLSMNETARFHTYPKRGKGTKLEKWGCNPSVTVILTRFDDAGNVQALTTVNELGEYEFATITSTFQKEHGYINIDNVEYKIARGDAVVPLLVQSAPSAEMVDETGRLIGKGLAQAHAVISEHFWNGSTKDCPISEWNFYAIAHGIVDDSANTMEAWVETSYVIHHMTDDDEQQLPIFSNNNSVGVWRCIDIMPFKHPAKSQHQITAEHKSIVFHASGWKYDPFVEFEIWHADQSFVAAMACDFVKDHYHFHSSSRAGKNGFGHSKPRTRSKRPLTIMRGRPDGDLLQMVEVDLDSKIFA